MSKRATLTDITPLPRQITRKIVIDALHDHGMMISLNSGIFKYERCRPPTNATAHEFHCTWYEITEKISYLPGGLVSGNVKYKSCFYDTPTGLQVHVYAPMGLDIKNKWFVGGNMPDEPREVPELGVDKPIEGLYLREDVEMRCSTMLAGFAMKNLKKAHAILVERLIAKAEVTEALYYSQAAAQRASLHRSIPPPSSMPLQDSTTSTSTDEHIQELDSPNEILAPPPYRSHAQSMTNLEMSTPHGTSMAEMEVPAEPTQTPKSDQETRHREISASAVELPASTCYPVEVSAAGHMT